MDSSDPCLAGATCLVKLIGYNAEVWPVEGQLHIPFDDEDLVKIYGRAL